jgi:hypothetical protein
MKSLPLGGEEKPADPKGGNPSFMSSKRLIALAVLAICGLTTGCGSGSGNVSEGTVSEQAARTAFEKSHPAIRDGKMKLILFRKIKGGIPQIPKIPGERRVTEGRRYRVEYWAELELLKDDEIDMDARWREGRRNWENKGEEKWKKGDVVIIQGWLKFEETEEGWLGPDGNVY